MWKVNSIFPHWLARWKREKTQFQEQKNVEVIHITTDCVFSGVAAVATAAVPAKRDLATSYSEMDMPNTKTLYGISKALGEPASLTIIRTSIVGEELRNKVSLLEWLRKQQDQECDGFVNHYWNGITCLYLAEIIHAMLHYSFFWTDVLHLFSTNTVSKYTLLKEIASVYKWRVYIKEKTDDKYSGAIDKSLCTCRKELWLYLHEHVHPLTKPLFEQLEELKLFGLRNLVSGPAC